MFLFLSAPRSLNRPGAYSASLPLYAPLPQSARGLFGFFTSLCPAPSIDPGLIQLLYLSAPRPPDLPGAYLASFPLYAPLPQSTRGLFSFFISLRPALPIGSGLIWLLFLSTPRSLNLPGAYSASLPLYAPPSRSSRGLFCFFASLRPALSIVSGLDSPPAAICAPCTQKSASDDNIVMRQTPFCTYSLHCFFT